MKESNAKHFTAVDMGLLPSSTHDVKAQLMLLGWRSIADWARAKGYTPHQVVQTLKIWLNRKDKRTPYGAIALGVLVDLSITLESKERSAS